MVTSINLQASQTASGVNPLKSTEATQNLEDYYLIPKSRAITTSISSSSSCGDSDPQDLVRAKAAMKAVYLLNSIQSLGRKFAKKKKAAKAGTISKAYDVIGVRPQPTITSLQRQITVQMRLTALAYFTTSSVANSYLGTGFPLQSFDGYTQYTALFDQYRFEMQEVWIEPTALNVSTANTGILITAVDLDDSNTPTSLSTVEDKQGSLTTNGLTGHYHRWKPHMAVAAYSGTFTSYSNEPAGWIDSASPAVQMYGLKLAASPATAAIVYNVYVRAKVSFRAPGL